MKKPLTIVFAALYLTLSVGLNILVHTCGGESETLLATTSAEDPCGCADSMSPEERCCTTVISTVQLDDAQKTSVVDLSHYFETGEFIETAAMLFSGVDHEPFPVAAEISPPPNIDRTILYSVFLI